MNMSCLMLYFSYGNGFSFLFRNPSSCNVSARKRQSEKIKIILRFRMCSFLNGCFSGNKLQYVCSLSIEISLKLH